MPVNILTFHFQNVKVGEICFCSFLPFQSVKERFHCGSSWEILGAGTLQEDRKITIVPVNGSLGMVPAVETR